MLENSRNRMAAGAAPREFHPGPCLWVRRAMLCGRSTREYHYAVCVSPPTSCHTCFTAQVFVARPQDGVMAHRPHGSTQTECIRLPMLPAGLPLGFLCQGRSKLPW